MSILAKLIFEFLRLIPSITKINICGDKMDMMSPENQGVFQLLKEVIF